MPPPPPPPPLETAPAAPPRLFLAAAIAPPEPVGQEMPSIGSRLHYGGRCRPCTFFHTRGCENNQSCMFCHLCRPGEKRRRLKAQKLLKRESALAAMLSTKKRPPRYRSTSA